MWKLQDFSVTQILLITNVGHFEAKKTAILTICAYIYVHLWILNFWELLTFLSVKFFQISKLKASKIVKLAVLTFWSLPILIWRKIRVVEKWLNFNTVEYPLSKSPIRLPRSVCTKTAEKYSILRAIAFYTTNH